jgi:hypothetical protein
MLSFVWTSCPAPDAFARSRPRERHAIAICSGNSAGLSNRRAISGLQSSMMFHAAPNGDSLMTSLTSQAESPSAAGQS